MIFSSVKAIAFAAILSFSALMSGTAQAAILHTANGAPVTTASGVCVTTGFEGDVDCLHARMPAVQETVDTTPMDGLRHERTVYFDFNKSVLTAEAKNRLDHLAKHLQRVVVDHPAYKHDKKHQHHTHMRAAQNVVIVGFADRVGNAEYNEKLALKRAQAVRDYLVTKGIKADKLEIHSLGKSTPSANCAANLPRAKLIPCLREDRRVEIQFTDCAR